MSRLPGADGAALECLSKAETLVALHLPHVAVPSRSDVAPALILGFALRLAGGVAKEWGVPVGNVARSIHRLAVSP